MHKHIRVAAIIVLFGIAVSSCDSGDTPSDEPDPIDVEQPSEQRVVGVCFMHDEKCVSPYVDLGPYDDGNEPAAKSAKAIPVYVFPSVPSAEGGIKHPADADSLYNPYRLQNNVFADDGKVWAMWMVLSADLNLVASPSPGVVIWGDGADQRADFKSGNVRDLFADPYLSEEEILAAADAGYVRLVNLFRNVDCPLVDTGPNDIIINLNPGFPICD